MRLENNKRSHRAIPASLRAEQLEPIRGGEEPPVISLGPSSGPKIPAAGLLFHGWRWASCSVWSARSSCRSAVRAQANVLSSRSRPPQNPQRRLWLAESCRLPPGLYLLSKGRLSVNLSGADLAVKKSKNDRIGAFIYIYIYSGLQMISIDYMSIYIFMCIQNALYCIGIAINCF